MSVAHGREQAACFVRTPPLKSRGDRSQRRWPLHADLCHSAEPRAGEPPTCSQCAQPRLPSGSPVPRQAGESSQGLASSAGVPGTPLVPGFPQRPTRLPLPPGWWSWTEGAVTRGVQSWQEQGGVVSSRILVPALPRPCHGPLKRHPASPNLFLSRA